jgi:hypothetical protein
VYALVAKIIIVYGALVFVLLQFRPDADDKATATPPVLDDAASTTTMDKMPTPDDRLAGLEDVTKKITLRSRYDKVIDGDGDRS